MVQVLLKYGANVMTEDAIGNMAISYAVMSKALNCVKVLAYHMKYDENIFKPNKKNQTVFDLQKDIMTLNYLKQLLVQITKKEFSVSLAFLEQNETEVKKLEEDKLERKPRQEQTQKIPARRASSIKRPKTTEEPVIVRPEDFLMHKKLGKGSFGEVYLVEKKDTKNLYAMKIIPKSKLDSTPSFILSFRWLMKSLPLFLGLDTKWFLSFSCLFFQKDSSRLPPKSCFFPKLHCS